MTQGKKTRNDGIKCLAMTQGERARNDGIKCIAMTAVYVIAIPLLPVASSQKVSLGT